MRWKVTTNTATQNAITFCKTWLYKFDCESLSQVTVKRGKPGYGVYGWCDFDNSRSREFEITLHIPGPFPFTVVTKESKLKLKVYGLGDAVPPAQSVASRNVSLSDETVTVCLETRTTLEDHSEGLVFLFGHELHHFLVSDGSIEAEDTEHNADSYGRLLLDRYRCSNLSSTV